MTARVRTIARPNRFFMHALPSPMQQRLLSATVMRRPSTHAFSHTVNEPYACQGERSPEKLRSPAAGDQGRCPGESGAARRWPKTPSTGRRPGAFDHRLRWGGVSAGRRHVFERGIAERGWCSHEIGGGIVELLSGTLEASTACMLGLSWRV